MNHHFIQNPFLYIGNSSPDPVWITLKLTKPFIDSGSKRVTARFAFFWESRMMKQPAGKHFFSFITRVDTVTGKLFSHSFFAFLYSVTIYFSTVVVNAFGACSTSSPRARNFSACTMQVSGRM